MDGRCSDYPPTEKAVAAMLKGTSHKPNEIVNRAMGPMKRVVTVEKVAINAVMAGCKPEYLPICLTMVETGSIPRGPVRVPWDPPYDQRPDGQTALDELWDCLHASGQSANETINRFARLAIRNLAAYSTISTSSSPTAPSCWVTFYRRAPTRRGGLNVRYGFTARILYSSSLAGTSRL